MYLKLISLVINSMILPQLEQGNHMVDVIGMFFFDDNILCLQKGNEVGERLSKIAKEKNMLLMTNVLLEEVF